MISAQAGEGKTFCYLFFFLAKVIGIKITCFPWTLWSDPMRFLLLCKEKDCCSRQDKSNVWLLLASPASPASLPWLLLRFRGKEIEDWLLCEPREGSEGSEGSPTKKCD